MSKEKEIEKLYSIWLRQKIKEMADENIWQPESENK